MSIRRHAQLITISPLPKGSGLIFFRRLGVMGDYTKTWLSIDEQATELADRGIDFEPCERLFNRTLQNAPSRPKVGKVPLLDHLRAEDTAKSNVGVYNALAVIAQGWASQALWSASPDPTSV